MKLYYDTRPVYPYICIADSSEKEIQMFIQFLRDEKIIVTKFYEKPKYPASDGVTYDYLLRIAFSSSDSRIKPEKSIVEAVFNKFLKKDTVVSLKSEHEKLLDSERKHFLQLRSFLDSERKLLKLDKQYFKEQLESLSNITTTLKKENNRISKFIDSYNDTVTKEIQSIIGEKTFNNQELKELETKLLEKENVLKEKENTIKIRERELEEEIRSNENYRNELEKEYQSQIQEIRDISLGVESKKEDSIQDLRILIFGNSRLNYDEIFEIFNQQFFNTFGENLDKKCIEAKYLDYKSVKNSNINKKIKQNKYDYIIIGQHDHSSKGKNLKHSYSSFIKENNLKAILNEDYDNPLNKERYTELAEILISDWESQFEVIEYST